MNKTTLHPPSQAETGHGNQATSGNLLLDLCKVDRRTALRTWLIYHGITEKQIAEKLNVSASTVTRLLAGERRNQEVLNRLSEIGIPPGLISEDD